jgi:tripartite-type tricarboxylate transporter receptor subunit TctC
MKANVRMTFVLAALGLAAGAASAQEFTKPLQIVSPNPPGANNDFIARLIQPRLGELLHTSVIVENRASANGVVGTEYVARAAPDGSVIAIGNSGTHAVNATLYRQLPYDPVRDFAAITEVAENGLLLVAHPNVPANSVPELIELAKRRHDKLNMAVAGATGEVAGNALMIQAKIRLTNIPYKGGAPAVVAVISGEVDMTITTYGVVIGNVKSGKMKVLAVTGAKRMALLRDEVVKVLNVPQIRERLVANNFDVIGNTPEQFTAMVKREVEKYRKIILESGMARL